MPLPPEKRLRFFVYVIESPSAADLYQQRSEAELIRKAVNLDGILCLTRCVISREAFEVAIRLGLPEDMKQFPELIPVIHISGHGHSEGIALSSGEIIPWQELKDLLRPINAALRGGLLVCMSCCEGYAGSRMAMFTEDPDLPFFAIVGCDGSPTWSDTAVGYATFYHLLAKGEFVLDAVSAMRAASGVNSFFTTTAAEARQGYMDYIAKLNAGEVRRELQSEGERKTPSLLAKLRELDTPDG